MTPTERRWLTAILAIALAVRLAWALVQPRTDAAINRLPDQREYLDLARNFLRDGSFHLFDPRFGQDVLAYRLPGYAIFEAVCGGSVGIVRLVQAVVDTSTVWATYLLAKQLSGSAPGGLTAAAIIAANPFLIYFSGLLLTETVFTAAIVWATVAATRRALPAMIALLVVALYLRPTALVLGPAIATIATNSCGHRPYYWRTPLVVAGALLISLLPWMGRNLHRLNAAVWTTTNDGITFYDGFHEGANGASDQRFVAGLPVLRSMNEVERSRYLSRQAWQWVSEHPKQLWRLSLRKIARGWSPVPLSQDFGRPLYRWVGGGYAVPFDLLCLLGLASRRVRCQSKSLLLVPAVVLTAVQVLTVGSIRYRVPAEPALAVLAGIGAVDLWQRIRRRPKLSDDQPHAVSGHHPSSPV